MKTGLIVALAAALVSGVSVYVNSFGVRRVPDPFVFTTAKNTIVAMALVATISGLALRDELARLSSRDWIKMAILGAVGGGVPFLLFFWGLREASAPSAALMHKTLFIWVAILAIPILKEKVGGWQIGALAVLLIGNLAVGFRPSNFEFGLPETLTLTATLIWAVEAVVARRFLSDGMNPAVAAAGRMGFGAVVMLGFVVVSGRAGELTSMGATQWVWVLITAVFLYAYVIGYYSALKLAPATVVSSILVLGSVITTGLHFAFNDRIYEPTQVLGLAVIVVGAALWAVLTWRAWSQRDKSLGSEVSLGRN